MLIIDHKICEEKRFPYSCESVIHSLSVSIQAMMKFCSKYTRS